MKITSLKSKENGLVAIIITMILMIILGLITVGFARLVRREQTQALDRQLSTQAFYSAEAGVNDIVGQIRANKVDLSQDYDTTCNSVISSNGLSISPALDNSNNASYTCLLVDVSPTSLVYDIIDTASAVTIPVVAESGNISSISIYWQDTTGNTSLGCTSALGSFPPSANWPAACNAGMIRMELVSTGSGVNRISLINNTLTAFLQPQQNASAGTLGYNIASNNGATVYGNCSAVQQPRMCKVIINSGLGGSSYYLRLRSIYKPNSVVVTASSGGGPIEFLNAQAVIDSTGKANDVLRRISVRIPLDSGLGQGVPPFAIQSGDSICKKFSVAPGIATTPETDPACAP